MMRYRNGQMVEMVMVMVMVDLSEFIPENHLLRRIEQTVTFSFIYELMAPLYSERGRPSVDPVCIIKMLLIGYFAT